MEKKSKVLSEQEREVLIDCISCRIEVLRRAAAKEKNAAILKIRHDEIAELNALGALLRSMEIAL